MNINHYEDIYPLTLIQMRYGGKYVAFNIESDNELIHEVQLGEEAMHNLEQFLEERTFYHNFGIGDTIWEALEHLLFKQNKESL